LKESSAEKVIRLQNASSGLRERRRKIEKRKTKGEGKPREGGDSGFSRRSALTRRGCQRTEPRWVGKKPGCAGKLMGGLKGGRRSNEIP